MEGGGIMKGKRLISLKELAEHMNISYHSAYRLVHSKGFPSYKIGGLWRVDVEKLEHWLNINNEQKIYL